MCFARSGGGSRHGLKGRPGEVARFCGSAMVPCAGGDPAAGTQKSLFSFCAVVAVERTQVRCQPISAGDVGAARDPLLLSSSGESQ